MAVGFDSATESTAWTTTPDPFTFTATPAGSATWALLYIVQGVDDTDDIDGLPTLGGVSMERYASTAVLVTEPARIYAFFLRGSWNSVQTVSIPHTATANTKIATLVYGTGTDCGISAINCSQADGALSQTRRHRIGTATAAMRFVAAYTGAGDPANLTPLAGQQTMSTHDFGANACKLDREDGTSTDFTIGFTETGSVAAQVAVAVEENTSGHPIARYRHIVTVEATSHIAPAPSPTATDDLILAAFVAGNNGGTITTHTGLTRFDAGGGNSTILPGAFWRNCDGSETTFDIVTSSATNSNSIFEVIHIPAALRDPAEDPECTTTGPTASGTPDPNGLTPSWGSATNWWHLWVIRDANDGITSLTADYAQNFSYTIGETTELASSWRSTTATSEDPGAATVPTTDEEFICYLVGTFIEGDTDVTGTGASTLGGDTSAGTGTVGYPGTGASTLDGVTSAGTGLVANPVTGTGASTLDGVTSAGTGLVIEPVTGTGASTLDGVTSAGTGTLGFPGSGTSTLDGVTSQGSGVIANPVIGSGTSTLDGVTSAGEGHVLLPGSIGGVECELVGVTGDCVLVGPAGACDSYGPTCETTMGD